jgi:SWI/SNF-related matrix-associated actin-dependent regulator 1 of chromatin subfamily A
MLVWEVTTSSLFLLIKKYKGSTKIHFDFGNEDSRNIFIQQIKKIEADEIEKRKFVADLNLKKEEWVRYKKELEETYVNYIDNCQSFLKSGIKLYPHQVISVMFLNVTRNALLALDMGTGKSLVSITYVEMNAFDKVFVITPNSLKYNYYNEVEKFTNSNAYIIGKKNKCNIDDAKYIITNYEYFNSSDFRKVKSKFDALNIGKIDCLVVDECHRIKSRKSNTYKAFNKIFKDDIFKDRKPSKIFMSGTPAPSKSFELYNVLHQISPIDFPTQKYFYEYYCGMKYNLNGFGWETNLDLTKFDELFNKIAPFIYRKKKSDILKDLPEKTYQKIMLEMTPSEYKTYYELEEGVANEFYNKEVHNHLSIMGKLREYTSFLKVNNVTELIDSILECGEKFVAIDFYKKSLYELHNKYPKISALHTGDVIDSVRAEMIKEFQDDNGKIKIFLGSESTTKEGLTLTAASKIGILSIPWTPGTLDQCTDRVSRIGQKNAVNAYIFIYKDTIDEYVFNLIEQKRNEVSQEIDGYSYESDINQSIINDLIKTIKNKHIK